MAWNFIPICLETLVEFSANGNNDPTKRKLNNNVRKAFASERIKSGSGIILSQNHGDNDDDWQLHSHISSMKQ